MTNPIPQHDEEWFLQPDAPIAPTIYNYNPITGEFINEEKAVPSPREYDGWLDPAYSTRVQPLDKKDGYACIFDETKQTWADIEDYRGQTWFDENGNEVIVTDFGNPEDQGLLKEKPKQPEPDAIMPPLTARQFWQAALNIGVTEEGLVLELAEPKSPLYIADDAERESVLIDIKKTTQFSRDHYLIEKLTKAKNIPTEQLDSLWQWASRIE